MTVEFCEELIIGDFRWVKYHVVTGVGKKYTGSSNGVSSDQTSSSHSDIR